MNLLAYVFIFRRLTEKGADPEDSHKLYELKCCFTSTETVGLLGTGAQDVHLDFHTAPELCRIYMMMMV